MARKQMIEGGTKNRIREVGGRQIFEHGYDGTSVRGIMLEVGGEVGLFYYYYKTKDELFTDVLDHFFEPYRKDLEALVAEAKEKPYRALLRFFSYIKREVRAFRAKYEGNMHRTVRWAIREQTLTVIEPYIEDIIRTLMTCGAKPTMDPHTMAIFLAHGLGSCILHEDADWVDEATDNMRRTVNLIMGLSEEESREMFEDADGKANAALAVPACAAFEDVFADGSADGTRDGSLFLSGETVRSSAAVNGVLLAAGKTVGVNGTGAYVMAAGYEVTLGGTAENDAFLAGYSIGVSGTAQRDVFAAGQSITVNGTVGRDLYAAANTVTITGSVGGDVYISAENVVIGDGAKIGGRLHCNASALRSVPDGIADSAELYDEPESSDVGVSITVPDDEPGVGSIVLRKALSFAGVLLLAFVLLWLTPLWETVDRKYYGAPFGRYAKAFGIGFAVLAGVPLAAILLFISNVGVRLALIVLFLYAAAIIAAPVFLGFFLGALLWRGAMKKAPCYYAELAIGILVWRVAASVPGLSFAVGLVSVPLGLGVVTLLLGKGAAKPSPKAETACEECAASAPAVLPEDSDSAEQ